MSSISPVPGKPVTMREDGKHSVPCARAVVYSLSDADTKPWLPMGYLGSVVGYTEDGEMVGPTHIRVPDGRLQSYDSVPELSWMISPHSPEHVGGVRTIHGTRMVGSKLVFPKAVIEVIAIHLDCAIGDPKTGDAFWEFRTWDDPVGDDVRELLGLSAKK